MKTNKKPKLIYVAEIIYLNISDIKKDNLNVSTVEAIEKFIETELYKKISIGKFHDDWFKELKDNNFIDKETNKKIPDETIKLLEIQKDILLKQSKNTQTTFDLIWRMCESYELWCKESNQKYPLPLNILS